MDDKDGSWPLIKKMILAAVAGFLVLFLVQMSRMPPEGPWVTDSAKLVLPSLRYSHINEPWAKAYLSEEKPSANKQSSQPASAIQIDSNSQHSYFSSPRMISARNNYSAANAEAVYSGAEASANTIPLVAEEDLLRPDVMTDTQNNYSTAFGAAK